MHKPFKHAGKVPTGYFLLLSPNPVNGKHDYVRNGRGQRWVYDATDAAAALTDQIAKGNLFARLVASYKLKPRAKKRQARGVAGTANLVLELVAAAAAPTAAKPDTANLVLELAAADALRQQTA